MDGLRFIPKEPMACVHTGSGKPSLGSAFSSYSLRYVPSSSILMSRVAEVVGVAVQNQPGGRSIGLAVVGCQQIV